MWMQFTFGLAPCRGNAGIYMSRPFHEMHSLHSIRRLALASAGRGNIPWCIIGCSHHLRGKRGNVKRNYVLKDRGS